MKYTVVYALGFMSAVGMVALVQTLAYKGHRISSMIDKAVAEAVTDYKKEEVK